MHRQSLFAVAAWLALAGAAPAHDLGANCKVEGGRVLVTAFFEDDTPARGAKVRVFDAQKQEVAAGQTDAEGRWACPAPPPGAYLVVVDAGGGHRADVDLTVPAAGGETVTAGVPREEHT